MSVFPAEFVDRLRGTLKLSEVASRWVKWDTRKSDVEKGSFWACCPFHHEETASFHVDDRRGYYYCFGCRAKGDAISLLREKDDLSFVEAVRRLAFVSGLDVELEGYQMPEYEPPTIIQLKDVIVENFSQENFLEMGVLTGWGDYIQRHDRLLRSLSWGDPDYSGHVLDLLIKMDAAANGSIEKVQSYVKSKFANEATAVAEVATFSSANRSLGYNFEKSRNDVIGVMMPFGSGFGPVYATIQTACNSTPLSALRADEMWDDSILINDILALINHSAVVICDLTGRNENVFYELGIAHAWGKPVIPIAQSAEDVPFDLRHHRYIKYLNNTEGRHELQEKLVQRLIRLVGSSTVF